MVLLKLFKNIFLFSDMVTDVAYESNGLKKCVQCKTVGDSNDTYCSECGQILHSNIS